MKKRLIPIGLALILIFSLFACNEKKPIIGDGNTISVYRLIKPEHQDGGRLLGSEEISLSDSADPVLGLVYALSRAPGDEKLTSALPKGVKILDAVLDGDTVTVYMNKAYLDLSGIQKTLADFCITLSMCSLKQVNYTSICVGSELITERLSSEDALLFDGVTSPDKVQIKLYFPKLSENLLSAEYRSITLNEDNSPEREILDELLRGTENPLLRSAIPKDTVLLSAYTQDGICTVSLSKAFLSEGRLSPEEAKLAVYSLVNSLTNLAGIESVKILIEGAEVQSIGKLDLSRPLERNKEIIGSAVPQQTARVK
ncbi:MAG: GerMN domain-containing protein [Oscillospiraceae bacterium]